MNKNEYNLRVRLVSAAKFLFDKGLTYDTSGNISARIQGTNNYIIKPSGYRFCDLDPNCFVKINIKTKQVISGDAEPSIETPFHTKIYQHFPEVSSIVHVHPRYSIILSIVCKKLILMGYDIFKAPALAKGIPVSKFAPPGTEELADNLVIALRNHVACLMPHHGLTAIGKTIEEAVINAEVVEKIAQLQYEVSLIGEPKPLPKSILDLLIENAKKNGFLI
jgi:L-fuculose-phosphate aldolase